MDTLLMFDVEYVPVWFKSIFRGEFRWGITRF